MKNLEFSELVSINGGTVPPKVSNDPAVQGGYSIGYRIGRAIGRTVDTIKAILK